MHEWVRDLGVNGLPNLSLVRLPHDHFRKSGTPVAGGRTPLNRCRTTTMRWAGS
jgi:hypothetical protein